MNSRIKIIKGISETINEEIHENKEITDILKSLIDGVSVINLKGVFTSVNDKYAKIFDYCEEELLGKKSNSIPSMLDYQIHFENESSYIEDSSQIEMGNQFR